MTTETTEMTETRAASDSGVIPYRLTVRQFSKMIEAGVFPEGAHVELLGGILVGMTKNDPHNFLVCLLSDLLRALVAPGWSVREEKSSRLGKFWRPEPDIVVARGRHADYAQRAPGGTDIGLLVEVAESSYRKDVGVKLRSYAAARIPSYWIVNVEPQRIEVYTGPTGRGGSARYQTSTPFTSADLVPVVLDGREVGRIAVADLFPAPPTATGPSPGGPSAPVAPVS